MASDSQRALFGKARTTRARERRIAAPPGGRGDGGRSGMSFRDYVFDLSLFLFHTTTRNRSDLVIWLFGHFAVKKSTIIMNIDSK
jgi:hypothetical protein